MKSIILAVSVLTTLPTASRAGVVINEIFYHSPADLEDLEYVELFNTGPQAVDLGGWKFTAGIGYTFPDGARIEPGEYLVLCKNGELFEEFYALEPFGTFERSLDNGGETLTFTDDEGRVVESVTYDDRAPWPVAADGYSASIERICPSAPAETPINWAPSTLSDDYESTPSGTPGKKNSTHTDSLPPIISSISVSPEVARPGQPIHVNAIVTSSSPIRKVELLYRVVAPGQINDERTLAMEQQPDGTHGGVIPGQPGHRIVRLRLQARDEKGVTRLHPHPSEIRPGLSVYVSNPVDVGKMGKIPAGHFINVGAEEFREAREYRENRGRERPRGRFGGFRGRRGFGRRRGRFGDSGPGEPLRPQGRSAFIYVDAETKRPELFDFINITERKSGFKVRFHKDRPLTDITTLNVVYEWDERSMLAEALAYEFYRRAGHPASLASYLRLSIDGHLVGYHLAFEQPNKAFLRRNGVDPDGNLYKIIWQGTHRPSPRTPDDKLPRRMDIVSRHEKKTHPHEGYADLVALIESLEETEDGDELWRIIRERFDVDQVINYFAVNMLLSHWDGFFNNYFLYHDADGTGRWMLFPWDQDSTWGHRMARRGDPVFYEMPLTFGMEGDVPPGADPDRPDPDRPDLDRSNFDRPVFDRRESDRADADGQDPDRADAGRQDPDRADADRRGRGRRFGHGGFGGFGGFGRGGARWWRPGGEISRPLLANPQFRKRFLARLKSLARDVYTERVFGPVLERLREQLETEVELRAKLQGEDEAEAVRQLEESLAFFREHLIKRRKWVLERTEEAGNEAASPTGK